MWHGMGVFYARQQMYDRAVEFFRKALEIDPSYRAAQDGLKRIEQLRQHP